MTGWSREALGLQVDAFAREHEGDAFVQAVETFGRELDRRERKVLFEVLIERAKLRSFIADATRQRVRDGWTRRMLEGRFRRRPPAGP